MKIIENRLCVKHISIKPQASADQKKLLKC